MVGDQLYGERLLLGPEVLKGNPGVRMSDRWRVLHGRGLQGVAEPSELPTNVAPLYIF